MSDPANLDEFFERFKRNQAITGFGADTTMHVPCPFCAAADWLVHRIVDTEKAYMKGATCKACGRSCRSIFRGDQGGVTFEFVQTGGPDQPEWVEPKMRRVP